MSSKLTPEDVIAIRASRATERELAEIFGVSQPLIHYVKSGRKGPREKGGGDRLCWASVPMPEKPEPKTAYQYFYGGR